MPRASLLCLFSTESLLLKKQRHSECKASCKWENRVGTEGPRVRALRVPRTFQHIRTLPQYRSHWHPFYRWKNKLLKIPQLQCGKAGFELRLAHVPLYTTPSFSSSHLLGSNPPPTSRLHQAPVPLDASTRPPGLVLGKLLGPDGCSARSTTSSMPTEENLLCAQGLVLQGGGGGGGGLWGKDSQHRTTAAASLYHPAQKWRAYPEAMQHL